MPIIRIYIFSAGLFIYSGLNQASFLNATPWLLDHEDLAEDWFSDGARHDLRERWLILPAHTGNGDVSPVRNIRWRGPTFRNRRPIDKRYRTIDGTENNLNEPEMGATHTPLVRLAKASYGDGIATVAGADRPTPRAISNAISAQPHSVPNRAFASDLLWQWGQFLDHDIDLTDGVAPPEPANIPVPIGDPHFDPESTGRVEIRFNRSIYDPDTGTSLENPRQQVNEITAWIDGSMVYGSNSERALALRTMDGTGRLRTSDGDLLPFNRVGLPNAGGDSPELFLAGDVRANEQVGLLAMHTLFVREHNRLAGRITDRRPWLSENEIYEEARKLVSAEIQAITYNEYLPTLLGKGTISPYRGYDSNVNAGIVNAFSSALYRYGHSALSPVLKRLNANGAAIPEGHLPLRNAFFSPERITDEGGIAPILRGLAAQRCQEIDPYLIDDVRNFLFAPPGSGGFDLASLNIQRGRDHGVPSYNDVRAALGLTRKHSIAEITDDPELQATLEDLYGDIESVDLWVAGLAETHIPGAMTGELVTAMLKRQFEALRDGDRFWYRRTLSPAQRRWVDNTRLSDVIKRNTNIGRELAKDVFHVRKSRPRKHRFAGGLDK